MYDWSTLTETYGRVRSGRGQFHCCWIDWCFFLQIYQTSNDCCQKEDGCCLCIPARVLIVVVYKTKVVVFKTTCAWLVSSAQCGRCFQDQEALAVSPSLSPWTFPNRPGSSLSRSLSSWTFMWTFKDQEPQSLRLSLSLCEHCPLGLVFSWMTTLTFVAI